jgi:putative ABC transport system permease protein
VSARHWIALVVAQWRDQPLRLLVTLLALAAGVALASAVYFVNAGALGEFDRATRRLVGESELVLRGPPRTGFPESLFATLARLPEVEVASPVLELEVALAARDGTPGQGRVAPLRIVGLDPFRAGTLQPQLFAEIADGFLRLFEADGIFLSESAAARLGVAKGDRFEILVGTEARSLRVLGLLSSDAYPQPLGLMDIASAQWLLGQVGRLNRIDLRLARGVDPVRFRTALAPRLPPGVQAIEPQVERERAVSATRAYRVNLNMLALVSLLTGAFLVFATQSLSVLRRRRSLALLRALGVTRGQLRNLLFGEGLALGATGSLLGVLLGHLLAAAVLERLRGDLGGGQLSISDTALAPQPLAALAFFLIGTVVAGAGAWLPAREAADRAPAAALKAGDAEVALAPLQAAWPGVALLCGGALLALLPPLGGMPVAGYASVALLLFGGVLLVPRLAGALLARLPRSGFVSLDTGLAQLRGGVGQFTVSLAAIIVSFSLMVAMAIMVHSFRDSFERWLGDILPADVQLRAAQGSDTASIDAAEQAAIRSLPGVERAEFRRLLPIYLDPERAAVTLIARDLPAAPSAEALPLLRRAGAAAAGSPAATLPPLWMSEAMGDLYGWAPGQLVTLPIGNTARRFRIAGTYRDYGRSSGSVIVTRDDYLRSGGDALATEGSLWLRGGGTSAAAAIAAVRGALPRPEALELLETTQVRELSLRIFDRAFLLTYALEAVAVVIGLLGVAFAASSTALARRAEFGMLRHIGLLRRQVLAMIGAEGLLTSLIGVGFGLVLGGVLSLVLVYVINRQSFSWSVELAVPWLQLAVMSAALLVAAAATAVVSGRAAMGPAALRAVREDW